MRLKIAVFLMAKYSGLFALARWYTAKQVRILCYHGGCLGDEKQYNPKLFSTRDFFQKRIDWLMKEGFQVISLTDAISGPEAGRKKLATVLTFDDGWYSTGSELLPVLTERKLPSTLYLCTQHFLEAWPVVNVSVRYLLWKAAGQVNVQGLGSDIDGKYDLGDATTRNLLARKFVQHVSQRATDRGTVCKALEELASAIGLDPVSLGLASRRIDYMSDNEIKTAAANGCSIELHGHVHQYPLGKPDAFRADLKRCDEVIGALGLPKPRHYCYPSGEFDDTAASILADLGVVSATTCVAGLVKAVNAPRSFFLPRFLDGESIHPIEFEAELSGFSELMRLALRRPSSNGYGR